jgi:murein DD-endopeptidase MepM/ murein hydrolase activator NlpD
VRARALLVIVAVAAGIACRPAAAEPGRPPARTADVLLAPDSEILRALVPPHTTLAALLQTHHLLGDEVIALVQTLSRKLDLRRVRAGQAYRIDRYLDGRVREFEYEIDLGRKLVARRTDAAPAVFHAEIAEIPRTTDRVVVQGEISRATPSLVQALEAAGERIELSLSLADIFSGELDFSSDLQPGDTFRLIVERSMRDDGVFAGYGPVLVAEYVNAGRRLQAIRFTPPEGKPGYYDADGRSLKRFFLKSPLKFEPRITSSFSRARRHPVLNYTRAHNGVDYAAPTGAPVGAVAAGVVTFAGSTSGGGRTVRLRHTSGYESEYLHLSSITVSRGEHVGQGELIGRVGATGLATGPHLHYGLRRNGAYVNPVRAHQSMPPGEPVSDIYRAQFDADRDRLFRLLANPATRLVND